MGAKCVTATADIVTETGVNTPVALCGQQQQQSTGTMPQGFKWAVLKGHAVALMRR